MPNISTRASTLIRRRHFLWLALRKTWEPVPSGELSALYLIGSLTLNPGMPGCLRVWIIMAIFPMRKCTGRTFLVIRNPSIPLHESLNCPYTQPFFSPCHFPLSLGIKCPVNEHMTRWWKSWLKVQLPKDVLLTETKWGSQEMRRVVTTKDHEVTKPLTCREASITEVQRHHLGSSESIWGLKLASTSHNYKSTSSNIAPL